MVGIGVVGLIRVRTKRPMVLKMAQTKSVMIEKRHIVRSLATDPSELTYGMVNILNESYIPVESKSDIRIFFCKMKQIEAS